LYRGTAVKERKMKMKFNKITAVVLMFAAISVNQVVAGAAAAPRLFFAGDSTLDDAGFSLSGRFRDPYRSWGTMLLNWMKPECGVANYARSGASTKSFVKSGLWDKLIADVKPGDFVAIQFGHNDNKPDPLRGTDPFGSYADNLAYMAGKLMEKGVSVYFITSISRRHFTEDGTLIYTHGDYPAAMKYAGCKLGIPVIDLSTITMIELQKMGELESRKLYMYFEKGELDKFPEGKIDNTHLKKAGAEWISRLICEELLKLCVKPNFLK
jgi:lysophospholipase L1-like esterase